jgi:hypothetical protein
MGKDSTAQAKSIVVQKDKKIIVDVGGGGGYVTLSMYGRKAYILCLLANRMYIN